MTVQYTVGDFQETVIRLQRKMEFFDDLQSSCCGVSFAQCHAMAAIRQAGKHLGLYHVADSNRQGVGRGHTDFGAQAAALHEIGYTGPVIVECTAPGPDPFTPIKGDDSLFWLETFLLESRDWLSRAA